MKKLFAFLVFVPSLSFAQGSVVESGLQRAVPYAIGIGGAISIIGLVFAGIKYCSGDPLARETAKSVFIGAVLIFCASGIGLLLKSLFPSN